MKAPAPRVLMVGTALEGRGGVAAVVSVLRRHGLFERESVRYVATHRDGTPLVKVRQLFAGVGRTLAARAGRHPAIVHVHAASHASFLRKSLVLLVARLSGCKAIVPCGRLADVHARGDGGACTTPGRRCPARPAGGTSARNHRTTLLNRGGMRALVRNLP